MDLRDPPIDFVELAHSLGVKAARVTAPQDIGAALLEAIASGAPRLVEFVVDDGFGER